MQAAHTTGSAVTWFSPREVARLEAVQHVFLSRLSYAAGRDWRQDCAAALRRLTGAEHAVFFDVKGEEVLLQSDDTDAEGVGVLRRDYRRVVRGAAGGDPHLSFFVRQRLAAGAGVFTDVPHRTMLMGSPTYREVLCPAGLRHLMGPSLPLPDGEVSVLLGFERPRGLYGERGVAALRHLLPALRFGVAAHRSTVSTCAPRVAADAVPSLPDLASVVRDRPLTRRQAEVALLLAQGLTDRQVASRLAISPHTARRHVEAVLRRLEVPSRAAVALRLLASGALASGAGEKAPTIASP